jgi:hypothetical protein
LCSSGGGIKTLQKVFEQLHNSITKYEISSYLKIFSFFTGVVETGDKPLLRNISENFLENSKWPPWYTEGAQLFHEKNLYSKILCPVLQIRIWDPGFSAFLTPGPGIWDG